MAKTRSKAQSKVQSKSPVSNKTKSSSKVKKPDSMKKTKSESKPESKSQEVKLDSSFIPTKVLDKAISELSKYTSKLESESNTEKSQLFNLQEDFDANPLFLLIDSKKYFSSKPQFKPKILPLAKSIYNNESKICLILRDQLVSSSSEIEQLENINLINSYVPLTSIKNDYKNFEKRREFHSSFDYFFVDDAILNIMPNALGKIFYQSNKLPIPIKVTSSNNPKALSIQTLTNQIEKLVKSTWYLPPQGSNISIKVGYLNKNFTQQDLVNNTKSVIENFNKEDLKTVMIKTDKSPSLPLFYTDSLFDESDILKEGEEKETVKKDEELNDFQKGLLELGDIEAVKKVIGKKKSVKGRIHK